MCLLGAGYIELSEIAEDGVQELSATIQFMESRTAKVVRGYSELCNMWISKGDSHRHDTLSHHRLEFELGYNMVGATEKIPFFIQCW